MGYYCTPSKIKFLATEYKTESKLENALLKKIPTRDGKLNVNGRRLSEVSYPGFRSMKRLGAFLLPLDGMLVHRRSLPAIC